MRTLLICLLAPAAVTLAQDSPLSAFNRGAYRGVKNILLRSAEKMPEENYNFKPTDAQYLFCSIVLGEKNPGPKIEQTNTSKASLVALKDAFAYCDRAYDGSYDRALESEHFARGSAASRLRDHRHHAANYAATEHCSSHDKRRGCRDTVDPLAVVSDGIGAPLRSDRACALACATLRVAAAGLRLGATRDISMGCVAAARDRRLREDCVPHFVFRLPAARPIVWIRRRRFRVEGAGWRPGRCAFYSADTTYSGKISEHPGSLDRAGSRRDIPRRRGAATPLSRADLIRVQPLFDA
jgi:hypothetical protein